MVYDVNISIVFLKIVLETDRLYTSKIISMFETHVYRYVYFFFKHNATSIVLWPGRGKKDFSNYKILIRI